MTIEISSLLCSAIDLLYRDGCSDLYRPHTAGNERLHGCLEERFSAAQQRGELAQTGGFGATNWADLPKYLLSLKHINTICILTSINIYIYMSWCGH